MSNTGNSYTEEFRRDAIDGYSAANLFRPAGGTASKVGLPNVWRFAAALDLFAIGDANIRILGIKLPGRVRVDQEDEIAPRDGVAMLLAAANPAFRLWRIRRTSGN